MDKSRKNIPDQKTVPRATCQLNFSVKTAVNVKNAFNPIPGATKIGLLAYQPIIKLLKKDTRMVAVRTAENGIPGP